MKFKQFLIEGIISSPKRVRRPVGNGLTPMPSRELGTVDFQQTPNVSPPVVRPTNVKPTGRRGKVAPVIAPPSSGPGISPRQQAQNNALKKNIQQKRAGIAPTQPTQQRVAQQGARQPSPGAFSQIESLILQKAKDALQINNQQQFTRLLDLVRSTGGHGGDDYFGQSYTRGRGINRLRQVDPNIEAQRIANRLNKADPRIKQNLSRILSGG